jgi:hypothetical protein
MNKITLLKIALLCSIFSFAQNIDTTKYQKITPNDTIKNYYNQNNTNTAPGDTIKNYYPADSQQNQPPQQQSPTDNQENTYQPKQQPKQRNQIPQESPLMQKLYFGCNLALRFYSYAGYNVFYYDVSPNVGYKITDKFSAGVQIIYNNTIETYGKASASYSIIGGGVFARFLVLKWFFLQLEYDILTTPPSYQFGKRAISDEKLAGVGFKRNFTDKVSYYVTLMYDINPTLNSPYYYSPLVYRIGVAYNF